MNKNQKREISKILFMLQDRPSTQILLFGFKEKLIDVAITIDKKLDEVKIK